MFLEPVKMMVDINHHSHRAPRHTKLGCGFPQPLSWHVGQLERKEKFQDEKEVNAGARLGSFLRIRALFLLSVWNCEQALAGRT